MAHEHESGIPGAYDRSAGKNEWQGVTFVGDRDVQAAELNEAQTIARQRHNRVASLVAKDGDRIEGAAAVVDVDAGSVLLTPGKLFIGGDVLPVALATLYTVPMTGRVEIGVRVTKVWIDHEDDPSLLGIVPGTLSEGEPGAAREKVTIAWGLSGGASELPFVLVYTLLDGVIVDQTPPPSLSGINQVIALYDRESHGHYIVEGCRVTALGKSGGDQVFSIQEGIANIFGYKRSRAAALRHEELEEWDIGEVAAESHTFVGATPNVFTTSRFPIAGVGTVLVTKRKTVSVTRGITVHGADLLPDSSIVEIESVVQGGTTFVETTSWIKTGDQVDWSPAGAEPAVSSQYDVTYLYRAVVVPSSFDDFTITIAGGVDGTEVLLAYDHKLPRIDRLCLNQLGESVYVKGVSAQALDKALPPIPPGDLLPLAQIKNSWVGKPEVENDGVYRRTYEQIDRMARVLENQVRLVQLERIKSSIDAREPTAKKGTFVDPFLNDFYRDAGEVQTAAVADGFMELAIVPTFYQAALSAPVMLDWVEEVIITQELHTFCEKINPYQNFNPMPGALSIEPAADFWTIQQTDWASPVTQEFNRGLRRDGPLTVTTTTTQVLGEREQLIEFLRSIPIDFTIKGFGPGEILQSLTFDGVDVKPPGVITADGNGEITGTFVIPSNITAGTKAVVATGMASGEARTFFVGQGTIEITTMRRVTTIERWRRPPEESSSSSGSSDPQAQTFTVVEARQLVGVDVKLCAIGDQNNSLLIQQVLVENGIPTEDVMAEAFVSMLGATSGWKSARYNFPVLTLPAPDAAIVVKTDDANHSLAMARLGDFDAVNQKWVGAQPYSVGVNLSSANAKTWTPHQERDLTFRVVAAKFTNPGFTKTVPLGSFNLVDASDLQVRAVVELPSAACSVVFEIVRANGEIWRVLPFQVLQLTEYITETVQLRAVLKGTEKLSPVLYAPVWFVAGKIAASGTYVSRAFNLGSVVKLTSYMKAFLPAGATLTAQYDKADDNWQALPTVATEVLSFPGWVERKMEATGINAVQGRLKFTITGGPAARPLFGDLGAAVM
ncbi:MAG: DUF4815 domain-containing protein [Devosia sp.]|uniref:DUF4815 domain-containing protein n=1 Tax=Devosia sp. TaxID=1871048 RepID=UPI001ACD4B8F|nr:DUF4815 domain-containing protein [Devosia sp.]MBN9308800.1 DUF4815 domain-containing protein [Devosia sp.]MBN9314247.1 DUF4815 domain-containing protein [Devosia sp.]